MASTVKSVNVETPDASLGLVNGNSGKQVKKPLSVLSATVTLTQNILGAGLLAMPFAFKAAGLMGALVLFFLIFMMSTLSMGVLVILSNQLQDCSYKGAAMQTVGSRMAMVIEAWVLCFCLGACMCYIILLGDFLHDLGTHCHLGDWATPRILMVLVTASICWPLSCAHSLGILKYTSSVGVLSIVLAAFAVVKRYTDGTYTNAETNRPELLNMSTVGQCFPILAGAFGAHFNVPSIYREVAPEAAQGIAAADQQGFRRMMKVIVASLVVSGSLYGLVGVLVYLTFGSQTKSDFTLNFDVEDNWFVVTRIALSFSICASFPLCMLAARNSLLKLAGWELTTKTQVPVATALVGFCLAVAEAANDMGVVFSYMGAVFGTPVCYVAPMVMYLYMPLSKQTPFWRTFSMACSTTGVALGVLGVIVVTLNLL